MTPCILLLTCADQQEADHVAEELLEKRLAACIKFTPIKSTYRWKNRIEKSSEILLMIDSVEENFVKIQVLLEKIHSYETFNLSLVKIDKTTDGVLSWLREEIS